MPTWCGSSPSNLHQRADGTAWNVLRQHGQIVPSEYWGKIVPQGTATVASAYPVSLRRLVQPHTCSHTHWMQVHYSYPSLAIYTLHLSGNDPFLISLKIKDFSNDCCSAGEDGLWVTLASCIMMGDPCTWSLGSFPKLRESTLPTFILSGSQWLQTSNQVSMHTNLFWITNLFLPTSFMMDLAKDNTTHKQNRGQWVVMPDYRFDWIQFPTH